MSSDNTQNGNPGERAELPPGLMSVARFEIHMRRYLLPNGKVVCDLPGFAQDEALLKSLYRQMHLTRAFDEKAIALQRTGRLGTYASALGQEGVGTGVANAMRESDVFLPSFREHGAQLRRGVTIEELLLFWGGDERGSDFAGPRRDFPNSIPVASHFPHAVGAALALKLRDTSDAAVVIGGDGATSKGDFYEALNIAGAWQLPVLFVVVNNGWAISVPRAAQSRAQTLAQKAIAGGIECEMVDGNDVLAMFASTQEALQKIRAGRGPRLIEAITYRLGDHTTADDARRYRDDNEVSLHWQEDPVARLRDYLSTKGLWTKFDEQSLLQEVRAQVDAGAEHYLNCSAEHPTSMFDHLFATLPVALRGQRDDLVKQAGPSNA